MLRDIFEEDTAKESPEHETPVRNNSCKNHPLREANWRCIECGVKFCDECVLYKGIDHLSTVRSAVCPECKEQCSDFRFEAEKDRHLKAEKRKNTYSTFFRYTVFFLFLTLVLLSPNDYTFFLFGIFSLWFGPLRSIDIIYKLGATLILAWLNNPAMVLIDKEFWIITKKEIPSVLVSYKKYFIESMIVFVMFFIVDKTSEGISNIYFSKRQINKGKFGVRGWILSILSILTMIFSVVWIASSFMSR